MTFIDELILAALPAFDPLEPLDDLHFFELLEYYDEMSDATARVWEIETFDFLGAVLDPVYSDNRSSLNPL